ncbi:MAG TPA: universal stress protein [Acidiphilium sp.]|jgi:nucleotide-binding universal stress UspA family protein|uniref:universal stress protein n=1 Tax=unclassified Acidiphilium TaxID=2617493 RepID=UPI000BCF3695|nr:MULTISPECIES: universal stress protein [unclassified Acidiphilium]OYV57427.1 MAG: universal stress protein UspA [Acidiphilium sp. 20-67-58]OYV87229.1 MAG: universal stress protein UspA [Acidiphilium sp. 21-68-69]HQT59709.1 universal stress protein [Acidiphilium sp.]HQU11470.1 universal stress protein [Acidiphilium sp.]
MAIRKILLPLAGAASARAALGTALLLGMRWQAHVHALHVRTDTRDVAPLAGEGLSGAMIEEMMATTEKEGNTEARALSALFDAETAARGIAVGAPVRAAGGAVEQASAWFTSVVGREDELVASEARLSDLIVVPHPKSAEDVASADALHAVLFDSGRPALIAPVEPANTIGTRIAIAWNGTAESASAVASIMPWLASAGHVRIFHSPDYQRQGPPAAQLAAYLELHGVAADDTEFRATDRSAGAGLLAAVTEYGADLLAMGAYSHSRLRQLILGGVTRHVLEYARLPVLMNR